MRLVRSPSVNPPGARLSLQGEGDKPMTRRAIIQIGTEKTGTTSLQAFLAANRSRLVEKGFVYPRFCGEVNQTGLAAFAMSPMRMDAIRAQWGIHAPSDVRPMRERMRAAAKAELDGTRTAIFCNEHCHSRLTSPDEVETLRRFLAPHFDEIRISIYLRRQDQVAVSLYSTRLKSGGTECDILPRTNGEDPYFNYDRSLRLWEDAFGRENVTVRLFDRKRLSGGSVVQDFLETWEIGAPEEFIATGNQNESVNPAAQEFLRHLNGHVTPIEGLPLDAVLGPLSASLAEHFPGSGAKPARAAAEAFYAMFRASNEAVRVRHFPDLASLFPEDFTSYPETCGEAAATLEDFAAIAAALQVENTRHIRRLEAEICIRDARLAWDKGETAPAMAALGRAVSWLPHHAPTHRIRGEYLLRSGCAAEAAEAARAATAHAPENFEYWHFLGVVLRSLGDLEGARDAQAHAVDLNPAHEPSRTCLEQIEQALAVQPEAPPASVARSA